MKASKKREKRRYTRARSAILRTLETRDALTWSQLLSLTGLSKGALARNLPKMLEDGKIVYEVDTSRRPARTLYRLGNPPPFFPPALDKDEKPTFDELVKEARKAKPPAQRLPIGIMNESFLDAAAEYATIEALMKMSARTLFLNPEPQKDCWFPYFRPEGPLAAVTEVRWFDGSLEEAAKIMTKMVLDWARYRAVHMWEELINIGALDVSKYEDHIVRNSRAVFEKHVLDRIPMKMKDLSQSGFFQVMNRGGAGVMFFSFQDHMERQMKNFKEKTGAKEEEEGEKK